jgi:uncharacterized membrane protein YcfT
MLYPLAYKGVHDILIRYLGVLVVFITFYHYRDNFDKKTIFNKYLLLIGQRTLDIYLLHHFLLPNLVFLKPILSSNDMLLVQLILASLIAFVVILICLLLSNVIRVSDVLGTYLLGAKRSKKTL